MHVCDERERERERDVSYLTTLSVAKIMSASALTPMIYEGNVSTRMTHWWHDTNRETLKC
jgi:hypothetical protein